MAVFASFDHQTEVFTQTFEQVSEGILDCKLIDTCSDGTLRIGATVDMTNFQQFEEALSEDPTADQYVCFNPESGRRTYRIKQSDNVIDAEVYEKLVAERGILVDTIRTGGTPADHGVINIVFPSREAVQRFNDHCTEIGFPLSVNSIHRQDGLLSEINLTDTQREALLLALDNGYFDVPRQATLSDVAAELDISQQSASELIRRGMNQLLTQYCQNTIPGPAEWES